MTYGPEAISPVSGGSVAPSSGYAPASAVIRTRRPVIVPSRRAPSSTSWTWALPCVITVMLSVRVSTYRTGRASRSASAQTATCSAYVGIFAPNPPPTFGAMTRTFDSSRPRIRATVFREAKGACTGSHTVSPPVSGSGIASAPFVSMGVGANRWLTNRARITTSASSSAPGSVATVYSMAALLPCSGNSTGASGSRARTGSITVGSGSYSTRTDSAASTACALESATTTTMGSPTKRTTPSASIGRANVSGTSSASFIGGSPRSVPVNTQLTPGIPRASSREMLRTRACAMKERTKTAWSAPSAGTSSKNRAAPVMRAGSSTRRTECPRMDPGPKSTRASPSFSPSSRLTAACTLR